MKLMDYMLEKSRVHDVPNSERNFHVFYYMLAGLSSEDKSKWKLQDAHKYDILNVSKSRPSSNDVSGFSDLKTAMKILGFKDKYQSQVFQVLAAILHLGNLDFVHGDSKEEAAVVKNYETLEIVAQLLGIKPADLENALVYKSKLIKKELCTMFLDTDEASEQRYNLIETLYSLLWVWLVESINKRLDTEDTSTTINLLDFFGLENSKENRYNQLMFNFTFEKLVEFANKSLFDDLVQVCQEENVPLNSISYIENSEILDIFTGSSSGIITMIDQEAVKTKRKAKISALLSSWNAAHESNERYVSFPKKSKTYVFGIKHHSETVKYDASDFIEKNSEQISSDFVTLFKGGPETRSSKNFFVAALFSEKVISLKRNPQNSKSIISAAQTNAPRRRPALKKSRKSSEEEDDQSTFSSHFRDSLQDALQAMSESEVSFVYCINPNQAQSPNKFDTKKVSSQVETLGIADLVKVRGSSYCVSVRYEEFADRYRLALDNPAQLDSLQSLDEKSKLIVRGAGLEEEDVYYSANYVFMKDSAAVSLTNMLRKGEKAERKRIKEMVREGKYDQDDTGSQISSAVQDNGQYSSYYEDDFSQSGYSDGYASDNVSTYGSEYSYMSEAESDAKKVEGDGFVELQAEEEEEEMSGVRLWWLRVTWFFTWWIPGKCLEWNGMIRSDIKQAWREKLALCILIFLISAITIFLITGFSVILCPRDDLYDAGEVSGHNEVNTDLWLTVHGQVYDYTSLRGSHSIGPEFIDEFAGKDASKCFFLTPSLCGLEADPPMIYNDTSCFNHPIGSTYGIFNRRNKKIWKGYLAHRLDEISLKHSKAESWWIIVDGNVYDMTTYREEGQQYLGNEVTRVVYQFPGGDATAAFEKLGSRGKAALQCMDLIHFAGRVDTRDSPQCVFANTLLLAATGVLVGIMVIKFLAALQLGGKGDPEDHDRFCILQVPCYTENEESIRRTLNSLARLRYDDKRKLLFIVADGNIIGSGNDRATWRIVLDILGVDPSIDPPKLSFQSLGEGNRQHNMGKVYTGLYDIAGHLIPYLVVVKVGKDNETRRPGNRGKRDSQMVLMRFLQKVHYDEPMSPLELEMYHQMKNVIGVDPSFYEFALMVDADTVVEEDGLNRLVSFMVHDGKVVGLCGETLLANEKDSWITMMQVYEYYISHHLAKAFESLFGSVTCLPGCFCMYRLRSPNKSIPLLISKPVIADYGINDVDTLHKKNLLSLGEDRYLTTLMLKHFPNMKICFTPHAQAKTYAPDRWNVLLSQRRRWINSTVHNLAELLLLPQLCGFCCFSMRFVVFFDLFATLVMPATMGYLVYLIISAANSKVFPLISLIMLVAAYGLQVIIFLMRGKFEHVIWLLIYLVALPYFTFFIPIYAFWHFDDFSWGNTRVVVGERGGKKQIVDEEPFDPQSIPMKKWSEYEQEMFENDSQASGATADYAQSAFSHHTMPQQSLVGTVYPPADYPAMPPVYSEQPSVYGAPLEPNGINSSRPASEVPAEEYPSNDQVINQIKTILATANLMTVTKKQVREELSMFFGVDMTGRKDFINRVIEDVLQGKM